MYFKDFPQFLYDFKYGTNEDTKMSIVTDITRNIRFRKEVLENFSLYDEYDIKDGETPEIIAEKVYGNPEYHWIIMLANQRYDYITDFPLDYTALMAHAANKYNPILTATDWYVDSTAGRFYFKIDNPEEGAFDPSYLTTSVQFTVSGSTSNGAFSITDYWGAAHADHVGLDFETQYFWVEPEHGTVLPTGTPTGTLTITTVGRENNAVYFLNADGFKVDPSQPGAVSVSGLQEEERLNESKRRIKIISPDVITQILKQYKDLM